MNYRLINNVKISSICFGTATFVAGRLFPNKNSILGVESLEFALRKGINFIHSNSNLKTQWAVRDVLEKIDSNKEIFSIIKIETPLNDNFSDLYEFFKNKIEISLNNLNIDKIFAISYEMDTKKTNQKDRLKNPNWITNNYINVKKAFEELKLQGKVQNLICMAHNGLEMGLAINTNLFDGYSAYFNLIDLWPISFLDEIMKQSKSFIGIRPLKMGIITENTFYNSSENYDVKVKSYLTNIKNIINGKQTLQSFSIRFCLAHPVVKSLIVGMSKKSHVKELINACENPLKLNDFKKISQKLRKLLIQHKNIYPMNIKRPIFS